MDAIKIIMIALLSVTVFPAFADVPAENPTAGQELSPLQQSALDAMSKTKVFQDAANAQQQINDTLQLIQAISAIADGLALETGTYVGVNNNNIAPQLPNKSLTSSWGSDITISNQTQNSYTVTISKAPQTVCKRLKYILSMVDRYSVTSQCTSTDAADFIYIYTLETSPK